MNYTNNIKLYKIYVHVNKINGKLYIGQTCRSPNSRYGRGGENYKNSIYLYNAIQKYGWENFEHIILIENLSGEEVNIIEKELIFKYKTTNSKFGYNLDLGGKNGRVHSKETIEKLRKSKIGINNPNYGKKLSIITRQRMSKSRSGVNHPFYGKHHTEDTKSKISDSLKGMIIESDYVFTQEHKDNLSKSLKNKKLSDETKLKMSKSRTGHIVSDLTKSKISDAKSITVFQYNKDNILIGVYKSATEAQRKTKIIQQNISKCCKGERKTAGGFMWKYNNELGEIL